MSLPAALHLPFFQHAFVAILFAGVAFPLIGVFIVSLSLVPLRFAMMHIALLGGAVGLFLGLDPVLFALVFCALASTALGPLSEKTKIGLGALSGFFMTLTLALAFILFSRGKINVMDAFGILWGNILSLAVWDLVLAIGTSIFIIMVVSLLFKEIQAILYDREIALSVGLPERRIYYLIVFVLGITVAVSMRLIGALLIDALVLLPAIAAHMVARSLKQMFFLSSLFGLVSGLGGLFASLAVDIPASSAIILFASAIIAVCILSRRRFTSHANNP
jgi:ABC-type Mn2+/Zn2+ transport system permease subunit